jgi:Protein of unknown function (DUF3325)
MIVAMLFLGQTAALVLLASAMPRHQRDLFGGLLFKRVSRGLRWAGAALLLAQAAGLCFQPRAIFWLEAFGVLSAALLVTVILISGVSAVRVKSGARSPSRARPRA